MKKTKIVIGTVAICLITAIGACRRIPPPVQTKQPIIAIIDSGVDATHPDLAGRLVPGFDFIDNDNRPDDSTGHGTEMAGIIASNDTAKGVCPECKIMPLKVSGTWGYVIQDAVSQAITYAIQHGARIIYVGTGFVGVSEKLANAVAYAEAQNVVIIAPAGNNGMSNTLYPAALQTVVSVVAVDDSARLLPESNSSGREVVAALGENIQTVTSGGGIVRRSGSSVAAARVAGAAGLALFKAPGLRAIQVRQILRNATDPLNMRRWYESFEYGQLNISKVITRSDPNYQDIAITRMTFFPKSPLSGQANFVRVRVMNQGNIRTLSRTLDVTWNNMSAGSVIVPSLDLGVTTELDIALPNGSSGQTVSVVATVEKLPEESELNDNSNTASLTYTSLAVHDVELDVGVLSEPVVEAGIITFPITVRNRGNQNEPSVNVKVITGDTTIATQAFNLVVGAQASMSGSWTISQPQSAKWHSLRIVASIPNIDADPENNTWIHLLPIGFRNDPGILQYANSPGFDVIIDAPWKTIHDYVPVLFFFPEWDNFAAPVSSIYVHKYNPATGTAFGPPIVRDIRGNVEGIGDITSFITFINPMGVTRSHLNLNDRIDSGWHYMIRIPHMMLFPHGLPDIHYLLAEVTWYQKRGFSEQFQINSRVLKVLFDPAPFPKFADGDRYYDAHVHTIAEQTTLPLTNIDAANKNFGGPIVMLLEASYALGLVDTQLNAGNFAAFKDRVVVTDHNVFYSKDPHDNASKPKYGPTSGTDGHAEEKAWYRDNLGRLTGEEVALKCGRNQNLTQPSQKNLGHHFLAYDTDHIEGPWHGGKFQALPGLFSNIENFNTMQYALARMKLFNTSGFGYAAHPNLISHQWPVEYFQLAIGFPPDHNSRDGVHVYPQETPTEFIFKGSQVWNTKTDSVAKKILDIAELKSLNPFVANTNQTFILNPNWDIELKASMSTYFDQIRQGLIYAFCETPKEKFIRKIYMSAGTDAHGDFNYRDDIESTASALIKKFGAINTVSLDNNAYARVRTYTLVHDRPASPNPPGATGEETSHDAYREGNTILTDGPLCKFNLDSDGRHNPPGSVGRWHDAVVQWENAEGKIGGLGKFDGGRTVLVPLPGEDVFIETAWKKSVTPGAGNIEKYKIYRQTQTVRDQFEIPAGPESQQELPKAIDKLAALVMTGQDMSIDERCITNPVWAVPVLIEIQHPAACPFPPKSVTVTFHFPISMKNQPIGKVFIRPLDDAGNSTNPEYVMNPTPGWTEDNEVTNGKYTCTNQDEIACPDEDWDARIHASVPEHKSWVAYMVSPTDINDNVLNDIGKTFVVEVEEDHFEDSEAEMYVEIDGIGTQMVKLFGPTTVNVALGDVRDTDGDGLDQVATEMTQLQLSGYSSMGLITVRLRDPSKHPFQRSTGEIEEITNIQPGRLDLPPFASSGTASSFFNVFFEVEVNGQVFHSHDPKHMQATITHKPPGPGDKYETLAVVELFDENEKPAGIRVSKVSHTPTRHGR